FPNGACPPSYRRPALDNGCLNSRGDRGTDRVQRIFSGAAHARCFVPVGALLTVNCMPCSPPSSGRKVAAAFCNATSLADCGHVGRGCAYCLHWQRGHAYAVLFCAAASILDLSSRLLLS